LPGGPTRGVPSFAGIAFAPFLARERLCTRPQRRGGAAAAARYHPPPTMARILVWVGLGFGIWGNWFAAGLAWAAATIAVAGWLLLGPRSRLL